CRAQHADEPVQVQAEKDVEQRDGGDAERERDPGQPLVVAHENLPSRTKEASRAQAPHSASSSGETSSLRTANLSSSRSVVCSISGPSVLKEKRTLSRRKTSRMSRSSATLFTTCVCRFEVGQISRCTFMSAS